MAFCSQAPWRERAGQVTVPLRRAQPPLTSGYFYMPAHPLAAYVYRRRRSPSSWLIRFLSGKTDTAQRDRLLVALVVGPDAATRDL